MNVVPRRSQVNGAGGGTQESDGWLADLRISRQWSGFDVRYPFAAIALSERQIQSSSNQ